MNKIGNIYLIWRKGPGSRRIPVGVIKRNSTEGVRFKYLAKYIEEAKKQGFTPYTGFPDFDKEYSNNVLEILSQRLMKSERNDLSEFYNFWKVDLERRFDTYYMLAQTQGIIPIDNFEFLADFNPTAGLQFITEIAGLSKTKIPADKLKVGDELEYELEKLNSHDQNAVKLFKDELFLGYVKKIHSRVFHKKSGNKLSVKVHHIERNGIIQRAFILVSV